MLINLGISFIKLIFLWVLGFSTVKMYYGPSNNWKKDSVHLMPMCDLKNRLFFKLYLPSEKWFSPVFRRWSEKQSLNDQSGLDLQIQWRSEIRPILDSEWSKRGWVANALDLKSQIWNPEAQPWNQDNWQLFCQHPSN